MRGKLLFFMATAAALIVAATPILAGAQQPVQAPRVTVGQLVSAINNIAAQLDALGAVTGPTIVVVDVGDVVGRSPTPEADVRIVEGALQRNLAGIQRLRERAAGIPAVANVLSAQGIGLDRVVAVDAGRGNTVLIFVTGSR